MPPEGDLPMPRPGLAGMALALLRLLAMAALLILALSLYGLARLIERPLIGQSRPVSGLIAKWFCRACLVVLGIGLGREGRPMEHPGAVVANHASWLDILALNGSQRIYFVSKVEVRSWPLIGPLAAFVGTIFIRRTRSDAAAQTALMRARFALGHKLLFFPEGTSTDSRRVLPFNPTLFAPLIEAEEAWVQPVSLCYEAPEGADPRLYGWFGEMDLGAHFLAVASRFRRGKVTLIFHEPLHCAGFGHRRELAKAAEENVRAGLAGRGLLVEAAPQP